MSYKLNLWVPGKGWTHIRSFRHAKSAHDFAASLEPLEVMIEAPDLKRYYGGFHVDPRYDLARFRNLDSLLR